MTKLIFKIQLPLQTNAPEPMALVYTITRANMAHIPITPELKALMRGRTKAYFQAEVVDGTLVIGREVNQTW